MRHLPALLLAALLAILTPAATAAVRFASPFGSHMVLQRDKPLTIWGTADPDTDVTLTLGNHHATAKADNTGHWSATLDPLPAGGPLALTATANNSTLTLDDILMGDVFLCSGQSNMQYGLEETADFASVIATPLPRLRLAKVALAGAAEPQDHFDLHWEPASPESAKKFSAVAYLTAYELYRHDPKLADVPIGLLEDCVGGTVIESWLPKPALAQFDSKTLAMSMFGIGPSALYNGMIAPLGRLPLAGVVWYQGEGNAAGPTRYAQYLPLLIKSWREQLTQPELPFLIVQLPDYATDWGGVYWQWIRESQANTAAATHNAACVVTINTNDGWDLHPQGKHEIARRLALLARKVIYHEPIPGRSPTFKSATVDGNKIRVTFDTDGSTLTSGAAPVEGFTLAGEDGVYHTATALIESPDTVVVSSASVPQPKTVRYAWAGVPRSTLSSAAGLPAAPFRTDDQPVDKAHGQLKQSPASYLFKSPRYQITIDANGRATSLVVAYKQLLSNADAPWGGTTLTAPNGQRPLSNLTPDGPHALHCQSGDLSADLRFTDDSIHWSITNHGNKDALHFTVALSPQVEVKDGGSSKGIVARRKDVAVTFKNFDRVTSFKDPAADAGGKVLEITIPAGQTRTIDIHVTP